MNAPIQLFVAIMVAFIAYYGYKMYAYNSKVPVEGYFDPRFRMVAELFREHVWSGSSTGCTLAIYHQGNQVLHLWGGYSNPDFLIPWRNYSLTAVASVTKLAAAFVVSLLVQRGEIRYDTPVTEYWPEFGENDKKNITIDMLLSHQSGLIGLEPKMPMSWFKDINTHADKIDELLAKQTTYWPTGTQFGYAGVTFGMYVDALVRHIDKHNRSISRFFSEEIAQPQGLVYFALIRTGIDFYVGLPLELFYRKTSSDSGDEKLSWYLDAFRTPEYISIGIATHLTDLFSKSYYVFENQQKLRLANNPEYEALPFVSGTGFATSDAIARLLTFAATESGNHLLSKASIDRLHEPLVSGVDSIVNKQATYGRVFWMWNNTLGEQVIGHTGYGGQIAFADRKNELTFVYLTNDYTVYALGGDPRIRAMEAAMYDSINKS